MARYKPYDLKQAKLIPVSYSDQIVRGSFEYALNEIVEQHLVLSVFEQRYRNADTGRLAYDPKVLLKIVLYGYYKGIVSSRKLAEACCRNVVFMALSADTRPETPLPQPAFHLRLASHGYARKPMLSFCLDGVSRPVVRVSRAGICTRRGESGSARVLPGAAPSV
jgi:hypothetical protein